MYRFTSLLFDFELPGPTQVAYDFLPYSWILPFGAILSSIILLFIKKHVSLAIIIHAAITVTLNMLWTACAIYGLYVFHCITLYPGKYSGSIP